MNKFPKYSLKYINKIRKDLNLEEIKQGIIKCNVCNKKFKSYNIKLNKTCKNCKNEQKDIYYNPCDVLTKENY